MFGRSVRLVQANLKTRPRDIIDLPEQVNRGDFVLRLSEGITDSEKTVANYVVTPQLAVSFDQALAIIKSAVDGHTSKAAYLRSFGSGKSHFMAVLQRRAYVTPAEAAGKSTWFGSARGLSSRLCQAVKALLIADDDFSSWSKRSAKRLCQIREEYPFLRSGGTSLVSAGPSLRWWTFAGDSVNEALAQALKASSISIKSQNDVGFTFSEGADIDRVDSIIQCTLAQTDPGITHLQRRQPAGTEVLRLRSFFTCEPVAQIPPMFRS